MHDCRPHLIQDLISKSERSRLIQYPLSNVPLLSSKVYKSVPGWKTNIEVHCPRKGAKDGFFCYFPLRKRSDLYFHYFGKRLGLSEKRRF